MNDRQYAKCVASSIFGVEAYRVDVEVEVRGGLPHTDVVGLAGAAVKEAAKRVEAAIRVSGYDYSAPRILVNLVPAGTRKDGAAFDLPIAVGILAATEQIPPEPLEEFVFLGELSLSAKILPVRGVLPTALAARRWKRAKLMIPAANAREAATVRGLSVYPVHDLREVVETLRSGSPPIAVPDLPTSSPKRRSTVDFAEVRGQEHAKRAVEVAAAGGHNLLLRGAPGGGKSMLARRIPTILPSMTFEESIETTIIHSVAGLTRQAHLVTERPFIAPHHTASDAALVGGGAYPQPGSVSIAHNGVLFLDEFPEFRRNVIEVLRQPMEDGVVRIARAEATCTFPARFMLVAAMNPCPCGFLFDQKRACHCTPNQVANYVRRISGPVLDRIDIQIDLPRVTYRQLRELPPGEGSAAVRNRVQEARNRQLHRLRDIGVYCNAAMGPGDVQRLCVIDEKSQRLLRQAVDQLGLSARAHDKVLRIARTIADLAGVEAIAVEHVAEAIGYRALDLDRSIRLVA